MSIIHRPLKEIAKDIYANWPKMSPYAQPYAEAMLELDKIEDMYYQDSAKSVVMYFLSNAGTWRGPEARRIKKELNDILKKAGQVRG
ncbi:hypothetical protein SEA_LILYPAD_43 [Gordonia phage LilyPad]|nr:hypothetical protein SEA_LILYPAD_43 [Gordonia phage LilyPad]